MADDRNEIRHVNWSELLSFTHVFKSFRLAIHPSKMFLALGVIVLVWLFAKGLDCVWLSSCNVRPGEIADFAAGRDYRAEQDQWQEKRSADAAALVILARDNYVQQFRDRFTASQSEAFSTALDKQLSDFQPTTQGATTDDLIKKAKADLGDVLDTAQDTEEDRAEYICDKLRQARKDAREAIRNQGNGDAREKLSADYAAAVQALAVQRIAFGTQVDSISGLGVYEAFSDYEWSCAYGAILAVTQGNFFGGVIQGTGGEQPSFGAYVLAGAEGFRWLLCKHPIFGALLLVFALAVWSLLGGAIYRIAALHAARDEKISIFQALRFALGKWPSFFTAPLIPLAAIFGMGALIVLGSLAVGNWWGVGSILLGVCGFIAILLGLFIAFISLGLLGGAPLMYPTIAVEGSDSFDAISRSFAYVFARPWRAGVYGLVALVYGVICYLFVRLFAFVALAGTYKFVRWGVFQGGDSVGASDKVAVMWAKPTFGSLHGDFNWAAMDSWERIGAGFLWVWVAVVAALVGAFLLSYFASSTTVIYYLLRRKVDATDLDDVYVQEIGEKNQDEAAATAAAPSAATAPSIPAAPTEPPAGETPTA